MIDSAPCPLAFSQERLWFLQMLDPRDRSYQFQSTLQFDGILDVDALERALGTIVARHAIFRTTFHASGGIPTAHVAPQLTVVLERVDIASEADPAAALQRSIAAALADPFDLAQLPLVRWTLVRVSAERHVLVHVEHHIIHDGWSFYLVLSELAALYRAYAHGSVLELEPAPAFADFARAQRSAADSPAAGEGLAYWKRTLSGAPALLAFPTDRPRPPVQTHAGDAIVYELPGEIRSGLEQLSRAHGATVFMTVFAAFAELLARYSGDTDICIGTGVAGRDTPELERLVGMLVNSVVLRVDLGGDPTFLELLERVRRTAIDAYAHAGIALERVVEAVAPPRDPSFNPLFTTMFSFHDSPEPTLDFGALRVTLDQTIDNASAKLDLNVVAIPHRAGITLKWEFNRDLFDRATMQRMVEHFHVLLAAIIDEPERRVSRFALAATHEQAQLAQFAHNVVAYERDAGIVARFNAVAAQAPQATALIAADGVRVSYAELDLRANRLAQSLQRRAGTPGTRVGLLLERSVDAIVAMLAVLKAGGVYVPLTPRFPRERIAWIIADAGIALTITDGTAHDLLPAQAAVLRIDGRSDEIADDSPEPNVDLAVEPASADALAYVMYTSGSTGKPKGVEVTGRGIARLVAAGTPIAIERHDIVANYASYAFDASTYEVWGALLNGAALAILPAGMLSLAELAAALERFGVSVAFLTTPLFHQMVETQLDALAALRLLVVGGDVLAPGHARRFVERGGSARLVNGYGPTENTTFTTLHEVTLASCVGASIPLGRPIANSSVYVLDAHRKPTAIDVPGEICSGGDGVARGYCGRPELTAERFVADPFAAHAGGRLYRTGDRGRWRGDGTLEFLGRADDQVKIRGFRVELGAVTAALAAHPAVGEAAVSVATSGAGENLLVAFVVPAPGVALDPAQLRADLAAELPDYEIPSRVSVLERLPAGVGGKIDRARLAEVLAEPDPAHLATPASSRQPTAALCGPVEERLGELWMGLLGLSAVTRGDDFFALGGHSLLAMRLLARINAAFEVELPLRDLFEHRTIAGLAEAIARAPAAQAAPRMSRAASAAPVAPDLGDLTAITDAELDALIARFSESG